MIEFRPSHHHHLTCFLIMLKNCYHDSRFYINTHIYIYKCSNILANSDDRIVSLNLNLVSVSASFLFCKR